MTTAQRARSIRRRGSRSAGKNEPDPELRDAQLDGPGAGLPVAIAVAVALVDARGRALAVAGAGQPFHLQFHHAGSDEGDHLPEEVGVGALLNQLFEGDPVDGHGIRRSVGSRWQTEPT